MSHGKEVVGYSCAGGEEDCCSVAWGVGWMRGVRAFDVALCVESLVWGSQGAVVQFPGHAFSS